MSLDFLITNQFPNLLAESWSHEPGLGRVVNLRKHLIIRSPIQPTKSGDDMPLEQKQCRYCEEMFKPVTGPQKVCKHPECQAKLKADLKVTRNILGKAWRKRNKDCRKTEEVRGVYKSVDPRKRKRCKGRCHKIIKVNHWGYCTNCWSEKSSECGGFLWLEMI